MTQDKGKAVNGTHLAEHLGIYLFFPKWGLYAKGFCHVHQAW